MQHDIQPAIIAAIITPIAPALKRLFDDDIEDDDDESLEFFNKLAK